MHNHYRIAIKGFVIIIQSLAENSILHRDQSKCRANGTIKIPGKMFDGKTSYEKLKHFANAKTLE